MIQKLQGIENKDAYWQLVAKKILDGAPYFRVVSDGGTTPAGSADALAAVMNKLKHGEERGHVRPTQNHTAIIPLRRLVTGGAFKLFADSLR